MATTPQPDDYCLHCSVEYQYHAEGKCLFEATTFVLDELRSILVRHTVKDMQESEDRECLKLLDVMFPAQPILPP